MFFKFFALVISALSIPAFATSIENLPLCENSQNFEVAEVFQGHYDWFQLPQASENGIYLNLEDGMRLGPKGITHVPTHVYLTSDDLSRRSERIYDPKKYCVYHKMVHTRDAYVKIIAEIKLTNHFSKWGWARSVEKFGLKLKIGFSPQLGIGGYRFGFVFYALPIGGVSSLSFADAFKLKEL